MTETTTPVPFGRPIRDLRSALEETVVLDAILEVATARKAKIKGYLESFDDSIRKALETGDGYGHEIPHVGSVTVTSPNRKAKIVDRDAFEAWVLREYPERCTTREVVDWQVVEEAMRADHDDVRRRILEILDDVPNAVTVETILPAKIADEQIKPKRSIVLEGDDGTTSVVVKETGDRIPGLEAPYASTPSLRVASDPDARSEVAKAIAGNLPEIATGEEGDA